MLSTLHGIVLKLDSARWIDLADPGLKPGRVEEKIEKKKLGVTQQDPVKNPVAIY